jgi:hypothetical protein
MRRSYQLIIAVAVLVAISAVVLLVGAAIEVHDEPGSLYESRHSARHGAD